MQFSSQPLRPQAFKEIKQEPEIESSTDPVHAFHAGGLGSIPAPPGPLSRSNPEHEQSMSGPKYLLDVAPKQKNKINKEKANLS